MVVTLSPADGFGEHEPEPTFADDIDNVPLEHRGLGSEVAIENERSEEIRVRVTRIAHGKLTVDGNHPRAGQTLKFVVTIVGVRPAACDELVEGLPADTGSNVRPH